MIEIDGKSNWFEFSNCVFSYPVMLLIGSRKRMCETVFMGLTGCANPLKADVARKFEAVVKNVV